MENEENSRSKMLPRAEVMHIAFLHKDDDTTAGYFAKELMRLSSPAEPGAPDYAKAAATLIKHERANNRPASWPIDAVERIFARVDKFRSMQTSESNIVEITLKEYETLRSSTTPEPSVDYALPDEAGEK